MSYKDRLKPNIKLTSPDKNIFTALWAGNDRAQSKKVGIFNFPGVNGSVVQDLGVSSMTYTLTLNFEGDNNDLESQAFMSALREKGVWTVAHPVHGNLQLQPLSFTPSDQPVSSGNITQIETEWIEPISDASLPSAAELQAIVAAQILTVNESGSDQLNENTFQTTAADVASFRSSTLTVVSNVEEFLGSISKGSATISAEMEAIKRDINAVLEVVPLDVISVAGQIQALIQLPARAVTDVQARLDAYSNFASGISLTLTPDTVGTSSYNMVSMQELALLSLLAAIADISSTGDLLSRTEAVEVIQFNLDLFNDSKAVLDASQTLFETQPIDKQYFSESQSYPVSARLNALTVAYLLSAAFNLKVEKRFVLTRRRNPAMVALEEYGGTGEGNANINFFNDTNKIEDNEFCMMLAGRELVVYV